MIIYEHTLCVFVCVWCVIHLCTRMGKRGMLAYVHGFLFTKEHTCMSLRMFSCVIAGVRTNAQQTCTAAVKGVALKKTHTCTENLSGTSSTSVLFVSSSEITHTHTAINAHASNICTLRKYSVLLLLLLLICIYALDICCSRTSEADE